jgi:mRNA interferase HigB
MADVHTKEIRSYNMSRIKGRIQSLRRWCADFCMLIDFVEQPLRAWYDEAKKAEWNRFQDIKMQFRSASIVGNDRVVFNIKGNDYRLIVLVLFRRDKAFIRFVGTRKEYDKIDAKNI